MDHESVLMEHRRVKLSNLFDFKPDAVLISDYDKGFLTEEMIEAMVKRPVASIIVSDAKREPGFYHGALLKCNREYERKFSVTRKIDSEFVITNGRDGPHVSINRNQDGWQAFFVRSGSYVECVNHIGAGDCFAAHLTLCLAHGLNLEDAATIAHSAGRVYVQHPHSRPPWPHEIRKDLDPVMGKVVTDLGDLRLSAQGRIVFTNGVFDLLGPHHLYLLQEAKKLGDCLVVGINADQSVKRLKGPSRPVIGLDQRLMMLCGLECVDWVVSFSDENPSEVMRVLKPDVLVKANFPDRNTSGDEFAKEVNLIPPVPGLSTSQTMNRIKSTC